MPAQGELRGPKAQASAPSPRNGGGDWDKNSADQTAEEKAAWTAPSPDQLQESRARQWALATRHDSRAQAILLAGSCEVCHSDLVRSFAVKGKLLIVTPWLHRYATKHEAVLADPRSE